MISISVKKIILFSVLVLIVGLGMWLYYYFFVEKGLTLTSPNGKEVWQANKTYQITWKAKKIGSVGIMLLKEGSKETIWIAKEVPALEGRYSWNIFVWEEPREDYKIFIFEYPWKEGSKMDYSDENFTILGPKFASCDSLSIEAEWPYISSDFPNLRKVFITKTSWAGNLEGLEGADKKCQEEAQSQGWEGNWRAFLGSDQILAVDRLNLDGVFVDVKDSALIPEGKICYRLLGKNFEEFFKKFSNTLIINKEKFEDSFLIKELSNIWLGRINKESKRDCTTVFTRFPFADPNRGYSFTTTCQNWTADKETVPGYPSNVGEIIEFPKCYNPQGQRIDAVSLAGLSSGLTGIEGVNQYFSPFLGKLCNTTQKLLCIQQ